ncbi:cation/multidrug efflux pump [Thioflavicoccus mobilis 8321]|uniref:Cation/multidrug efflux pump n=1 Tax=Thioflavicoccus mobilis 8321 TaxID=765912 RepID=L0GWM6_9GAMM|nr:efflux RND transporter permease subunit [Thioflavicoccus mobilis]AGA90381.1 cation/multidrug efflux pump [Thioflavicoccus mobilis 8321]
MDGVVRFTLRQQVLFNLLFVVMVVAGTFSVLSVPVERYPDVMMGDAQIDLIFPGASPADVEALVATEIEEALEGLEQVELISSTSRRELASIRVKFHDDTDYEALYSELRFRVLGALGELPPEVEPPSFLLYRTGDWLPVVAVNLVGERTNRALTLMAEELKVRMAQIPGVAEAELMGEYTREFHVVLDPAKLIDNGVSFDEVSNALQDANLSIPAGSFTDASGEFTVRVDERFDARDDVLSTIVRRDLDGSFATVADLVSAAEVGYRRPNVITSVNGMDGVTLRILKVPEGNALEIYAAVEEVVADARASLAAQGVEIVLTQDSTLYIDEAMGTLGWNLVVGICLVSLILWYFLGLRNAALVTIGIPFSFLVTMVLVNITGNSLNEITLFSFVLVSGIIVDDAIVVVENIYRQIQRGQDLAQAIVRGTSQVMLPVVSASATTIAAFLPMLIMTGSIGEFFAQIPKAVSFAILASLFECLLILPLHYRDFGPRPAPAGVQARHDPLPLPWLRRITDRLVRLSLRHRATGVAATLIAFVAAVAILAVSVAGIAPLVRIQFFPDDYNLYYASIEGPPDTPIETIDEKVRAMARLVLADGEGYVRSAAGFAGFVVNEDFEQELALNTGMVMVAMPTKEARAFSDPLAHLARIRERLEEAFGGDGFRIRVRAEKDGPPAGKDLTIRVVGSDEATVAALTDELLATLHNAPEIGPYLIGLGDDRGRPTRVYRLEVDKRRAQEYGLTPGAAARIAAAVLDGRYIGKYRLVDEEVDLKLRIDPAALDAPAAALALPVLPHPSGPVYLGDIVHPVVETQPAELHRFRGQRSLTITADIRAGAPLSTPYVVAWTERHHAAIRDRYPGATITFGGAFESTQRSFDSLTRAFGLAVLVIYLILATQFRSYAQPLIVLSAVMFAVIGVVFGNLVTRTVFTVNSFIAIVGITGVVVNGALVLLDFINRRYRQGATRHEAIIDGVRTRLRPIVLTALTTILGLLPMAIGIPSYSVIWGTMAATFVTGIATAAVLTLFIVPVAWDLLTEWQERRRPRGHDAVADAPANDP